MLLLLLVQEDDTSTRMTIGVDTIAHKMKSFFHDLGLRTALMPIEEPVKIIGIEWQRSEFFKKEYRDYGPKLEAI